MDPNHVTQILVNHRMEGKSPPSNLPISTLEQAQMIADEVVGERSFVAGDL